MSKCKYTSIGGQALIEGIMMKGPVGTAMAVRTKDGEIDLSMLEEVNLRKKYKILALPLIRGVVGFGESLVNGYKALMLSAEKSGFTDLEEEESTPKDEKKQSAILNIAMVVGTVLGVILAIVLFTALPRFVVGGLQAIFKTEFSSLTRSFIEQFLKLAVFVLYVWLVSFMKDIRRTFMYHGAEHKTIFCFEKGLPLTVENVRKQKRFHPRCGTSFMILMILISVIISTLVQIIFPKVYDLAFWWILIKIALIPLICGIGFEVLKICGKYDNIITKIISAPGLWLQRITTKEPDDGMIEIAIAALEACKTEKNENDNI
ncbi:MAG: DUF1385 domain-containing protein [Acutalibacteraceae bacterium]|nr:DUF1385 domain-containing protein [Acutalibacteraceae bacterium]